MTILLHLDASPRGDRSHSRRLTREFVETWKKTNPIDTIVYRDLGRNPIPQSAVSIVNKSKKYFLATTILEDVKCY